jgi:hypothetical protein
MLAVLYKNEEMTRDVVSIGKQLTDVSDSGVFILST